MKSAAARRWNSGLREPLYLRQETVPQLPVGAVAWWVTAAREGFTARASGEFRDHMQHSRDHVRLQLRILQ